MRLAPRWLLAGRSILAAWVAVSAAVALLLAWLGSLYDPGQLLAIRLLWVVAGVSAAALAAVFGIVYAEFTRRAALEALGAAP